MLGSILSIIVCKKHKGHRAQTCMKIQWHPITKTYWKLLLHGKKKINVKNCDKKDIKFTHVWEFNGINSITKIY